MSRSADSNGHDLCAEMASRDQKLIADGYGLAPMAPVPLNKGPSNIEHPEAQRCATGKENVPSNKHETANGSEAACSTKSQKSIKDNLDTSVTFAETFSRSDEVVDIALRTSSFFVTSEDHEEQRHFESRDCNISDERRDDDEERDDEQPNQNTTPFLQTRVEYAEPFVEKERTFMFLASSSDSWNFDVARETSLFDDDGSELDDDFDNSSIEQVKPYVTTLPFDDNAAQSKSRLGFGFCIWDHQW